MFAVIEILLEMEGFAEVSETFLNSIVRDQILYWRAKVHSGGF